MPVSSLHFDILASIAENLDAKSLVEFSLCCRALNQLGHFDLLWKRLCQADYHLTYNDPKQTYRDLYRQTTTRMFGRRPCQHLSRLDTNQHLADQPTWKLPLLNRTAEDWVSHLGGKDMNPAEQYYALVISNHWANSIFVNPDILKGLLALRTRRRQERWIRWQDTPARIVMNPRGFCFVSAQFMWEWERFIEGWRTLPPLDEYLNLNQQQQDSDGHLEATRFDPFLPEATDLHIVSHETWEYLSQHYSTGGPKITKDDLMHSDIHKQWRYTIKRYADRVMLRQ
ncbi:hypothetical protein BJV82DRAFT_662871 [Fennellomyces sp. T-0311]|nr:hypothetical protein BJV82DRAFT_662871 [Fennellomyces sp. T-0311]